MSIPYPDFCARWSQATGGERANYQLFLTELCELLELPKPEPAQADHQENAYGFERRVTWSGADGSVTPNFIDLYRRGCFVCEAKQSGLELDTGGWDKAMLKAQAQAERYARALPAAEGRPPFLIVTDVGRSLELYADFTRSGAAYTPFPDPRSHRIRLTDLVKPEIRERLRAVWLDPLSLDPSRVSARVTREIAARLAELAKSLEEAGHPPVASANFLMRCLFSMFAEDVGLLPAETFSGLLHDLRDTPEVLAAMLEQLWHTMDQGGLWGRTAKFLLHFNGGLFRDCQAPVLEKKQIDLLLQAARADWRHVEPSIFGTLLERALNPRERHKLGAHYTPRAYVERLVLPTLVEPLRAEWLDAKTAALAQDQQGRPKEAIAELMAFQQRLCRVRVLDPACGSGNFLYVALEHLKRIEGEVLTLLDDLGATGSLELEHVTVDPHQFLGLELNPRAAAIAEMVLWIGYLQWHYRVHGHVQPPQPVLRDFHNILCRDALLDWDERTVATDAAGRPLTRWDGSTTKPHPVTGQPVPDESAQVPVERFVNPRQAAWPEADFVVGNPPFIGASTMRRALGDGYVDALRATWKAVPESADFVMHWWQRAAELARAGRIQRFGFITTNSIRQTFNRRVLEAQLSATPPLTLAFAIPDHPWVDSADGAAVRIAMTVGTAEKVEGELRFVTEERAESLDEVAVTFRQHHGVIGASLSVGADVTQVCALQANAGVSSPGVKLHGAGFIVSDDEARQLGLGTVDGLERHIRPYRNGRDLMDQPRGVMVIDLFGLTAEAVRNRFPAVYQRLIERVKPGRDAKGNTKDGAGYARLWWLHGKPRQELRPALAGLSRYIATVETSRHRVFQFLPAEILPDNMLVAICVTDPTVLGVLSSRVHVSWSLATGARLGLGNDPRYNKSRCFDPYPLPAVTPLQHIRLAELGEALDAHRKASQEAHPGLTLTGMYNVLEALRQGQPLSAKEKDIHEQGLVSVLASLHDDIDRAVLAAYGWEDLAPQLVGKPGGTLPLADPAPEQAAAQEELLTRLVALNAQRAAEEKQGLVRWLRPEFQCRGKAPAAQAATGAQGELAVATPAPEAPVTGKMPWPKDLVDQVRLVRQALQAGAKSPDEIAAQFKRTPTKGVAVVLEAMRAMGIES
ncbi:MAG: DNA methyltransferase [Candidatus Delongbacteria bacterium]